MFEKTELDNGLRLVSCTMPKRQSMALGIWVKTGSRNEAKDSAGISHFLEHLVFKGTRNYSCEKLKESVEGVGGILNGFTNEEATCFLIKLPAIYSDLALRILSEMVLYPVIPPLEIEKERTVVLEEIKMYKDLPHSYVYELLDELLWPDHPLGKSVLGSEETVKGFTRQDLFDYKRNYYTSANIVISAAGALKHDYLKRKVADMFSNLKKKQVIAGEPAKELHTKPQAKILDKDTEQTHLAIGFHSFKRTDQRRFALSLLNIILGGNSSSRLFNEIRERRGLAYDIGTQIKRLSDTGAFIVHAGVDNQKVSSVIRLILQQLDKIKSKKVERGELKRAKEFYLGQLKMALEDTLDHMLWIGESLMNTGKTESLAKVVAQVNKIGADDLQAAAQLIFSNERLNVAVIGPVKKKERAIQEALSLK